MGKEALSLEENFARLEQEIEKLEAEDMIFSSSRLIKNGRRIF